HYGAVAVLGRCKHESKSVSGCRKVFLSRRARGGVSGNEGRRRCGNCSAGGRGGGGGSEGGALRGGAPAAGGRRGARLLRRAAAKTPSGNLRHGIEFRATARVVVGSDEQADRQP